MRPRRRVDKPGVVCCAPSIARTTGGGPMQQVNRLIGRNYGHPGGLVGRLTARLMRRGNADLNLWLVGLLDVQPADRVLEVGFGPGTALDALLARAADGFVAGVDVSALMVQQARARH